MLSLFQCFLAEYHVSTVYTLLLWSIQEKSLLRCVCSGPPTDVCVRGHRGGSRRGIVQSFVLVSLGLCIFTMTNGVDGLYCAFTLLHACMVYCTYLQAALQPRKVCQ